MALNRAYLMSESTADSKCSNNSPEIPLRTKESQSNHKETSIKVFPSVLALHFPGSPSDFLTVSALQYKSILLYYIYYPDVNSSCWRIKPPNEWDVVSIQVRGRAGGRGEGYSIIFSIIY